MKTLGFYVRDRQNAEKEDIEKAFLQIGLEQSGDPSTCTILAVHQNTDAPGKTGGIAQAVVDHLLARGGIYIEYSTGRPEWKSFGERKFYGSYAELLQRLSNLSSPISIDDLCNSLTKKTEMMGLMVLSILCQGYLAAHFSQLSEAPEPIKQSLDLIGWTKFVNMNIGKAFANIAADSTGKTEKPQWWQGVIGTDRDKYLNLLLAELNTQKMPNEIVRLIDAIFSGYSLGEKQATLVALAYLKLNDELKKRNL